MLNYLEYTCPVCHRPFSRDDDVVFCPECGAPHHRECWKKDNRCAYADTHATPDQWKPVYKKGDDDVVVCGNCGKPNDENSRVCEKCGHELSSDTPSNASSASPATPGAYPPPFFNSSPLTQDFLPNGGTMDEQAMDMATFVGTNAGYYLPRFQQMDLTKNKLSWNWSAFLFPVEWLLFRKMNKLFIAVFLVFLILALPSVYTIALNYQTLASDKAAMQTYLETGQLPVVTAPQWLDFLSNFAFALSLAFRSLFLMKGNDFYYRHMKRSIEKIRLKCTDPLYYRYAISKKGGTNLAGLIFYFAALIIITITAAVLFSFSIL